ncbi:MAG: lactate racemase domain-containing protein [Candidatus Micrarchaeota archaeon]
MKVSFGKEEAVLFIPEKNEVQVLIPHPPKLKFDVLGAFRKALANPVGKKLSELARKKTVVLLVQDQTRSIREKKEQGEAIFEELGKGKPSNVSVIIATGTHKPNDPKNAEIIEMLKEQAEKHNVPATFEEHDCEQGKVPKNYVKNVFIGTTPSGTPVYIDRKHLEADIIVGTSSMKMHYFAGYSNMLKLVALPGPAGYETVRINHKLILDPRSLACSHPFHQSNCDNPVSNDMHEAYKLARSHKLVNGKLTKLSTPRPVFILASVTDSEMGKTGVVWCGAGEGEAVTREGIRAIDRNYTFKAKPADIVIIGAGPAPHDRHLFYVHNGADTARRGLKKGGSMLIIAECPEGIGPKGQQTDEFVNAIKKPKGEILEYVRKNFQVGMQKSYKLGELLHEAGEVCVYLPPTSKLTEKELFEMHMASTRDPQHWLNENLKKTPDSKVLVITKEATRVALV